MTQKDEALRMAIEAMKETNNTFYKSSIPLLKAIEACKAALSENETSSSLEQVLPDGWVAVPVEPTDSEYLEHAAQEELLLFANESDYLAIANGVWELFNKRYKAMLKAIPTQLDLPDDRLETLLYAVETKYPNETRFETALRYIRSAEKKTCTANQAAPTLKEEG